MTAEVAAGDMPADEARERLARELADEPGARLTDSCPMVWFQNEATLRDGLAALAEAYGWIVQRERAIPGWGRLDLICHGCESDHALVIELKASLTKAAVIRKAFQQADGYARWLAQQGINAGRVILCAPDIDWDLAADVQIAYSPTVRLLDGNELINLLRSTSFAVDERRERAHRRLYRLTRAQRLGVHALNDLDALGRHADRAATNP